MKTRTKIKSNDELLTRRQWAQKGYIINNHAFGELMWVNTYRNAAVEYFTKKQVHLGSEEEIRLFFEPERRRKNESAKKAREEKRIKVQKQILIDQALKQPSIAIKNDSRIVVLNIETTGLDSSSDEILQISVCDINENILLNSFIRPYIKQSWDESERIHRITPDITAKAPFFHELIPELKGIFDSSDIIIAYNSKFVISFLNNYGFFIDQRKCYNLMNEFATLYGDWDDYHENYKLKSLKTCAQYFDYRYQIRDNVDKVKAILYCYNKITKKKNILSNN